jgi:hypothetical protein
MGEISWNDKPSAQIRMGRTKIRILDEPKVFNIHWIKEKRGDFIKRKCVGKGCNLCAKLMKVTPRYHIEAFDYRDQIIKLFEIGAAAYQQIREFVRSPSWGDPTRYDIVIDRNANSTFGGSRYNVNCSNRAPLIPEYQNIVDESRGQGIPVERLVLDGDDCPRCQVRGILDSSGFKCVCSICQYVIWERSITKWI